MRNVIQMSLCSVCGDRMRSSYSCAVCKTMLCTSHKPADLWWCPDCYEEYTELKNRLKKQAENPPDDLGEVIDADLEVIPDGACPNCKHDNAEELVATPAGTCARCGVKICTRCSEAGICDECHAKMRERGE